MPTGVGKLMSYLNRMYCHSLTLTMPGHPLEMVCKCFFDNKYHT